MEITHPRTFNPGFAKWPALAAAALGVAAIAGPHQAAVGGAVMAAALVGSIGGFAFSPICAIALLLLVREPMQAAQIILMCSVANQATMVWSLRRDVPWGDVAIFVVGGLLGLPAGVWLLINADRHAYALTLGGILLAYSSYRLFAPPRVWLPTNRALDALAGLVGGLTGGAAAFPSGPVVVRCGLLGLDARRQRALYQPYVLAMQSASLVLIAAVRPSAQAGLDPQDLLIVPASLVGTQLGMALFGRLSTAQFTRAITFLLLISGLGLLFG